MRVLPIWSLVALSLLPPLAASAVARESLGAAAKRERERREKSKEAGVTAVRTINHEDVRTKDDKTGGEASISRSADERPESNASNKAQPDKKAAAAEEAAWRARAATARQRVEAAQKKVAETPPVLWRRWHDVALSEENPEYVAAQKELKAAEQAFTELEGDARRQGVLPGWLR